MDIQNLQTFLAVAKLGSFTKAAEQNFISWNGRQRASV